MRSKSLKDYKVIIASDVNERDGIGIEIQDWSNERHKVLIEIFRDDENEDYTISLFEEGLPLELIEESIECFKKRYQVNFKSKITHNKRFKRTRTESRTLIIKTRLAA